MVIPGLFQTEDYARAVLRAVPHPGSVEDIDRQVQLRMQRQAVLTQASPPDLWVVLSESVLHVQVGSPAVMRAQLRRLIDLTEQASVTLQILPFSTAALVQPISPFTIMDFRDAAICSGPGPGSKVRACADPRTRRKPSSTSPGRTASASLVQCHGSAL